MRQLYFSFFFTFLSFSLFGQQKKIDSLKTIYKNESIDSIKVKILNSICNNYYYTNYTEGLAYVDTLMQFSRKIKQFDNVSFGHRYIGSGLIQKGKFDEAISEFEKSIALMDSLGKHNNKYSDYMNIGSAYRYARKFDEAHEYYNKAIEIAERMNKKDRLIVINNNLGGMAYEQEKYNDAITYLMKSLEFKEYNKNPRRLVTTYDNLGLVHYEINQYEKSVGYFKEALAISEKIEYVAGIADSKKNIAKCYTAEKKNIDDAIRYIKDAIEIYKNINDNMFLIEAYSNLGDTYEINDNLNNAIKFHKKAVTLAEEVGMEDKVLGSRVSLSRALVKLGKLSDAERELQLILNDTTNENLLERQLIIAYETKSELSRKKGDYKNAFLYQKKFSDLENIIQKNERVKDINDIETKYQTEKKEKELAEQKVATQEQELLTQKANTRNWLLALGLLAVVVSAFFIWRRYKSEAKAKKIISVQKDTIEELKDELHHRIQNNLNIINAFVDELKGDISSTKDKGKLSDLQNRISSIKEVYALLNQSTDKTNSNIELKSYFKSLVNNIASIYNDRISVAQHIDEQMSLDATQSFPVGLVINEFVTNSYKHAFEGEGEVVISFQQDEDDYKLQLSDNGKGLPDNFDINNTSSYGFRLINLMTQQLRGKLAISNNNGTSITISFPKPKQ